MEDIILTIMDGLEEFFGSLTGVNGRKLILTLYVTVVFLVVSVIAELFGAFTIISWKESLAAVCINLLLVVSEYVTKNGIDGIKKKIRKGGDFNGE